MRKWEGGSGKAEGENYETVGGIRSEGSGIASKTEVL